MLKNRLEKSASKRRRSSNGAFLLTVAVLLCFVFTAQAAYGVSGYHENDYQKLRTFFETTTSSGKTNGNILFGDGYSPDDLATWSSSVVTWTEDSPKRLVVLDVSNKALAGDLDLSGCESLTNLSCQYNDLTDLDVSGCTSLTELICSSNLLWGLDVSGCTALTTLSCSNNRLYSLDVGGYTSLTYLSCSANLLTSLKVSGCTSLKTLYCQGNSMTKLSVSGLTALETLHCSSNKLTSLDVSGCPSLTSLNCSSNKLTSLDVSGYTSLTHLSCSGNLLTSLDVRGCTSLGTLECYDNQLTGLDVSSLTALQILSCYKNQLTSLDVSGLTALRTLRCYDNQLTSLNTDGCSSLSSLQCQNNRLSFSNIPLVSSLTCSPQGTIPLKADVVVSGTIDLSAEYLAGGAVTTFTWYNAESGEVVTPATDGGGRFTFGPDFAGKTVYCRMTNSSYIGLTLQTTNVNVKEQEPPVINVQPQDQAVGEGMTATFRVEAATADGVGTLNYQWQKSTDGGNSWSDIPGATQAAYTTPPVDYDTDNGAIYRCLVRETEDGITSDFTSSDGATLSVVTRKPVISSPPAGQTVRSGDTATFTIEAAAPDGGTLSYQWQVSSDAGATWNNVAEATNNSYTTPAVTFADNGKQYRCAVANTLNGVTSKTDYCMPATLYITLNSITIVKPASGHDASNPVNISNGSMVIALINGELSNVSTVTIKVDDGPEQEMSPVSNTIYYLLPTNLAEGEHKITVKVQDVNEKVFSAEVIFYWENYRRGFGFGRFNFD